MTDPLLQAVIYLAAAVACVPIAKKLGMGSVLGYLTAGVVIGPFVLGFIGEEGKDIMHFAEFGVVMMLFLVGLELEPEAFWRMRQRVLGVGAAQLLGTALVCAAAGVALGLSPSASVAIGCALAMSSTAIALQSLKEKGLMGTTAGQQSFAVLLFQDIAVIPILALLPLLATVPMTVDSHGGGGLSHQPGWVQTLAVAAAVVVVVAAGRFVVAPALRVVARTRLRELFTASALLIVVATALLMQKVGLSAALGTFLAGVVLANSEFKHELESDLDPFKGLLLGLFFMGVGASIDFHLIAREPGRIALLTAGVVLLKVLVLFGLGRRGGLSLDQNLVFSLGLSQVGEFAFVLFAFIAQLGLIDGATTGTLMAVTALSMTSTPLLMLLHERVLQPRLGAGSVPDRAADEIEEKHAVIIAGFSHFGSTVGRFLRANGVEATILDHDSDRVDLLRRMGFKVYYGDATRADLLQSAGASEARILISAVDGLAESLAVVDTAKKHFPHLRVLVRARHRYDAYEIMDQGVKDVYREHLDTSIRLGVDVLRLLGHRAHSAHRAGQQFREFDEAGMATLAPLRHDKKGYVTSVRAMIALQEQLLASDQRREPGSGDHAWDSEELRTALK
jgi:CPA2 family monovalent cation:H+ antiporter-2